jgi:glycerate-2-kinase
MNWIKNWDQIATNEKRKTALSIVSAGLDAIDTEHVIRSSVSLSGMAGSEVLTIKGYTFDLAKFDAIRVVGFGKVVCSATAALSAILGNRIKSGVVIGTEMMTSSPVIESFVGSHPMPSEVNIKASEKIVSLAKNLSERDLIIIIVSGGGSSLLCWPPLECDQGKRLYEDFLKTGGTIKELNTVRKHISLLKGGGLAKILFPATVVGLIFSDVPGNNDASNAMVASGPTYPDNSTVTDAENVLKKYGLDLNSYTLNETPKDTNDKKYFEKVTNVPMISNYNALQAMAKYGQKCDYNATILSDTMYDDPETVVKKMFEKADENSTMKQLILVGGEPKIEVPAKHGKGGRNEHTTLEALGYLVNKNKKSTIFISCASDGHDNNAAAGAIADDQTLAKSTAVGLHIEKYLAAFDAYSFFEKTGDLIVTGETETNVSDLMVLLTD